MHRATSTKDKVRPADADAHGRQGRPCVNLPVALFARFNCQPHYLTPPYIFLRLASRGVRTVFLTDVGGVDKDFACVDERFRRPRGTDPESGHDVDTIRATRRIREFVPILYGSVSSMPISRATVRSGAVSPT